MNLAAADVIFILLIALLMIRCYLKGFVSEVLSVAAIVLGIFASLYFHKKVADLLREHYMPGLEIIPEIIAFIGLFVAVFIIVKIFEILLKGIIRGVNLGSADKFLGLIFGFAEGILLVSLILFILQLIKPIYDAAEILENSFFANFLLPIINDNKDLLNV